MEDRSLEDYLARGTDDEHGPTDDGRVAGEDGARPDPSDEGSGDESARDVDPATPTYRWTPSGTACTACGASVERGWFDDGAFVCADCKEW